MSEVIKSLHELGKIEIAPEVIQVIASISASEVEGVVGMSGGVVEDINQLLGRKNLRKGIKVSLGEKSKIELSVIVEYGYHLPKVGKQIQERVKTAVETMTGITVEDIIVRIDGIKIVDDKSKGETE